jgi:hypothetical protein
MPCVCQACITHAEFLGIAEPGPSMPVIRKAYKTSAKRWHPDRFEKNPAQKPEAEERFKLIQVAYRELTEHCESPLMLPVEEIAGEPNTAPSESDAFYGGAATESPTPTIFFGNMSGCSTAPDFSAAANRIILASTMEPTEKPLGFVDLSGGVKVAGNPSQYILLTSYRIIVRNALNIVAFLWFNDLGEIGFIDRLTHGKPRLWRRAVEALGMQPRYSLVISRHDGSHFHTIANEADDRIKKVIYNFLRQIQSQARD